MNVKQMPIIYGSIHCRDEDSSIFLYVTIKIMQRWFFLVFFHYLFIFFYFSDILMRFCQINYEVYRLELAHRKRTKSLIETP